MFIGLRARLERIAYRMLGSVAEAEDVVQETWLRWNAAAVQDIGNEEAWLVSVTTRLCVDRLRAIRTQREHCSAPWLLDFKMIESPSTPQDINERKEDVSMAYLILLQRLSPEARAAFLMHEIFDVEYDQIAQMLQKTQEACRQLVRRAKAQLRCERSHCRVPQEAHRHLLTLFVRVLERADFPGFSALFAEEAVWLDASVRIRSR
ncbi:sigma-70 family RNA polymerase sigma factor [Parapusillimonas sp. SGNA-6]|nr:sigma-70 family RNA polymerase sigma factor [Parapusillimonas sp. SGNA-6]